MCSGFESTLCGKYTMCIKNGVCGLGIFMNGLVSWCEAIHRNYRDEGELKTVIIFYEHTALCKLKLYKWEI